MGVIILKTSNKFKFKSPNIFIFMSMKLIKNQSIHVHYGGHIEFDKGFVLHFLDYKFNEEKTILKNNLVYL